MITLVISDNEGTTTRVPLTLDQVSIGRKDGNTIRLTERNISREHCCIQRVNGAELVIRDLNSYNGVIVNGRKVQGEQSVKPGDDIRIGDYTVALESDVKVSVPPPPPPPAGAAAQAQDETKKIARPPARLVVMTQPLAGADFSLPESGKVRVGRAAEVEVSIDHRSVSREHAVIEVDATRVRIIDQQSANGVLINGEKVSEATLVAGDIVELGDVLLRFVAAGDKYVFDPIEARALVASRRPRARKHLVAAGAIIGAAVVGAIFIVRAPDTPAPGESAKITPTKPATELATTAAPAAAAPVAKAAEVDRVPELVSACRDALAGGRFAEGVAHANAALKLRPDDKDAIECQGQARASHEQEQIYVRAAAALEAGDVEGAWNELLGLDASSSVAQRPEVKEAIEGVAGKVLERAVQLARKDLVQAAALARSVADRPGLPEAIQARAHALLTKTETSTRSQPARPEPVARPAPKPRPVSQSSGASPMDTASACLARGDNACVIRALAGRAQTAQELGLLIETYRALGESAQAYRSMATYVQRFPTARRAEAYRQMLARQGQ